MKLANQDADAGEDEDDDEPEEAGTKVTDQKTCYKNSFIQVTVTVNFQNDGVESLE